MLRVLVLLMIASWSLPSSALAVQWAYVPNSGSNDVTLIDTTTNVVTAIVPVGRNPMGVAVHPSGSRAYIANSADNTVSVVDAATARVVATISVGTFPIAVAMHPSGLFAYVTVDEGLLVINTTSNAVVSLVPISGARAVATNAGGTRAYVTHVARQQFGGFCDQVAIVDISNHTLIGDITFICNPEGSIGPFGVAVDPAGTFVYVAFELEGLVIIDATTNQLTGSVNVVGGATGVAVHPSGAFVYLTNESGNAVIAVNTATRAVIATIPVGTAPRGVAMNAAGTRAYVANASSNTVSVIDTATHRVATTIVTGSRPKGIGQFVGADDGRPSRSSCTTELDASKYTAGQTARISTFRLANPGGGPIPIELKAWIDAPGAVPTPLLNVASTNFLPGLDKEFGPFDFPIASDAPPGEYALGCRAVDPITGDLVSQDLNPFEVSSASTGQAATTPAATRAAETAASSTAYAYVTNTGNDTVSVIDTGTSQVILTVPVGRFPSAVAVHPRGAAAYTANARDRTVSVLDTGVTIPVDFFPNALAVHPSGTTLYAAGGGTISVISTSSNTVTTTVSLNNIVDIGSLAVDSTGGRLYAVAFACCFGNDAIIAIDTTTNALVGRIDVVGTGGGGGVAVHPGGMFVYAADDNTLYKIDVATFSIVGRAEVPFSARNVAVHPAGTFVYVIGDSELTVIDAVTMTVRARLPGAGRGVAVHPDGKRVYVTRNSGRVDIVDTSTHTVFIGFPVGDSPADIAIGPPVPLRSLPPDCEVTLTRTEYASGDAVVASSIRFTNPSPIPKAIEAKLWIDVPTIGRVSMLNAGVSGNLSLVPGAELATGPVTLFTVGPGTIRGAYQLNCRILDPVTAGRLAQDLNQFSVR